LQLKTGKDEEAIVSLNKAFELDTTQADVFMEMAKYFYGNKKYLQAAESYGKYIEKSTKKTLNDYLSLGLSNYFAYNDQYFASLEDSTKVADKELLVKADSAFSYIEQKATTPIPAVILYRARTKDLQEVDRNAIQGLAKPVYEHFIEVVIAKGEPSAAAKKELGEAYAYLGSYYSYAEKDDVKAEENFLKSKEYDPANKQAAAYFERKGAGSSAKSQ
jgi:tetratricopeptide (TPR) repeat protein